MAYRRGRNIKKIKILLVFICILGVSVFYYNSVELISKSGNAEDFKRLETAIKRAAVSCYACEGRYPGDISYLTEHYGLQIDEEKYTVYYECIGGNLMPDITVLENDGGVFELYDEEE